MKTLGMVGGIGPESTIEYYRQMMALYRRLKPDGSAPPLIINSIDLAKMLGLIGAGDLPGVTGYLLNEVKRLASAGADFGLLAANTAHVVFDDIQRASPIPLISIVEAACEAAEGLGLHRLGLLGTRFTAQGGFYPAVFSGRGIRLVIPPDEEQDYIHDKYLGELVNGIFLDETRAGMLKVVDRLIDEEGIQGLILGGTELPFILPDQTYRDIPFLDTTRIHVEHAVAVMLA